MLPSKENILFTTKIKIRFDDLSYGDHLCHAKVVNIIHNSRALFLKYHGLSEMDCFGIALIILKIDVEYLNQCFFDDSLEVTIFLNSLDRSTVKLSYLIFNTTSDCLVARANTLSGFFDREKNKITKLPRDFKYLIESMIGITEIHK